MCPKWIRLTPEEASEYPNPDVSRTGCGTCAICHGRTILYLVHVSEGEGEAFCIRCGEEVDAPMICIDQCRLDRVKAPRRGGY